MQRFPLSADRFGEILQAPLGFAIGMIVGTAWYFLIPFEPDVWVVWGLTFAVFAGRWLGLKWRAPRGVMYVWILVCGLVFGVAAGSAATLHTQHATVEKAIGPILVEGWVTDAQSSRTGVRLVLDIHAIDGLNALQTPETVRLTHILSLNTEPGRFVRCWAVLRPPPQPVIAGDYDFARQAWFSGLGAVGYVQGRCRGGALGAPRTWTRQADLQVAKWRRRLAQHVRAAAGERAGGFAAALASGDRSFMPQSDQEALRASGLAHLLAISGLHMGIVGGLVFLFVWRGLALVEPIALRVSVKKPAAMTALIACAVYLVISGASVSTQRAFIMSAVLFGAVLFDRTALSLRSLSIAMIAILLLAPWSVLTPGFQMSFAATGALIATYEGWQNLQRKRGLVPRRGVSFWLKSLVVTSTVSSFATMPFAMYHFDRVAGLGIFANLFAMPIISMVSAPLAALALLLAPLGGDGLALRLFGLSLEGVLSIAHAFAGLGEAQWLTLPAMPAAALGWFAAAIAIYVTDLRALPKAVSMMLICVLAGITWHQSAKTRIHFAPSGELFLEHASGNVDRIELRNGPGLPPLRFIDAPISQACEIGTPCVLKSEQATIVYVNHASVEDALEITISDAATQSRIRWSDVIQENGVTLEWRRDGFYKRDKPACGHRPWRACAED